MRYSKKLRYAKKIRSWEVAEMLAKRYPKCNKATVSMAENSEDYGVKFLPEAEKMILDFLGESEPKPKKKPARRLIGLRLETEALADFDRAKEEAGFQSTQAFLEYIWQEYRSRP